MSDLSHGLGIDPDTVARRTGRPVGPQPLHVEPGKFITVFRNAWNTATSRKLGQTAILRVIEVRPGLSEVTPSLFIRGEHLTMRGTQRKGRPTLSVEVTEQDFHVQVNGA